MADTTANYNLPLRFDRYESLRDLIEVALTRIDEALTGLAAGQGEPDPTPEFTTLTVTGAVTLSGLPTTDPAVEGALWLNAGVLSVSAGA